ncbi:MAG: S-layer homology domain-containing protein [Clostridia bacterium]|nr:S-layer homology domain-containing protein [Clostridia bacterium]
MRNLKKTLAVVLAFAMILSMGAISTFAYTDVAEGTVVSEAVSILSNLEILTGFEDGTFRPSETVTRAQMAAIICRMLGYEDQAKSSMGSTVFDDVAADHWASGYINVAQAQQIINGYGDGNFGPEDKVTYEQAVKMIVAALGYDLAAQSKGGYPTGYLAIASTKGITKSANGRVGDAAARSTIAVLVYNSLEVELMDQTSWSTGSDGDRYGMTGETVLSRYLGVKKYEGVVSETALTALAEGAYDPEAKSYIAIDDAKSWAFRSGNYTLAADALTEAVNADLVADADKYLGKKVVAYIGTEADAETGEIMLYAMAEKQGANATLALNAKQLVEDEEENTLVYKKDGSNKKIDVKLNLTKVYENYAENTDLEEEFDEDIDEDSDPDTGDNILTTNDFIALLSNGGTIELIDSDTAAAGYETAIITNYEYEAVVEEVETDDTDIFFSLYTGDLDDIDTESETELVVVYKDGEIVEPTVIAAGDTVTTVEIGSTARVLYVSSKNVTGSVDGWDDEAVTIAGEEYVPSALSGYSISYLQNKEGIFYLNIDGQIAYADASASKGGYAFFLNTGKDAGMGSKYYATLVMADGSVKAYNYAKTLTIGDTSYTNATASAYIAAIMDNSTADGASSYDADEAYAHVDTAEGLLFEVKIKNDEIKNLVPVAYSTPSSTSTYKEATKSLGAKTFDETSVMFALAGEYDADDKIEEDDIKVGKVVEMLADDEAYYVALPTTGLENGIYKVAVGYDLVASVGLEGDIIVITDKRTKSYNDDSATVITGIQAGKEVEIILYNEDEETVNTTAAGLGVGDIILTSTVNAEGVADNLLVLLDKSTGVSSLRADDTSKEIYYGYQLALEADDNFIWFGSAETGITEAGETNHYMVMQKSANTVLVDYTEDITEPEISKKSLSKSLIGNPSKYNARVFVRVIDEVVVDVVVYRTLDSQEA